MSKRIKKLFVYVRKEIKCERVKRKHLHTLNFFFLHFTFTTQEKKNMSVYSQKAKEKKMNELKEKKSSRLMVQDISINCALYTRAYASKKYLKTFELLKNIYFRLLRH